LFGIRELQARETAACAAQVAAVAAASWSNCEQLFGFLTSKLLTASDSGSGRASGRGRGRTCSVSDFQTSFVQVNPEKNCEQFQKIVLQVNTFLKKKCKKMQLFVIIACYRYIFPIHSKSKLNQISQWSTN